MGNLVQPDLTLKSSPLGLSVNLLGVVWLVGPEKSCVSVGSINVASG